MISVDLPEPLTPVTAVNSPSGMATSMFFMLLARAPRTTICALPALRRDAGVLMDRSPRRYAPVTDDGSAQQLRRRALEDDMSAVLACAGPEVYDVVGLPDRLFVVLDDDHGVAQVAQPASVASSARLSR